MDANPRRRQQRAGHHAGGAKPLGVHGLPGILGREPRCARCQAADDAGRAVGQQQVSVSCRGLYLHGDSLPRILGIVGDSKQRGRLDEWLAGIGLDECNEAGAHVMPSAVRCRTCLQLTTA